MIKRIILALVVLTGIVLAWQFRGQFDFAAWERWTEQAGLVGVLTFMGIYTVATVLFLPGAALTIAGGVLFGPVWGTLYGLTGATLGATAAFLVARYVASDWIASKTRGRLRQLINGVEAEGWRFVAFTRLVPLFPFNLLNYALGLTRIRITHYVVASYVFMFPATFAYTYLGFAGREALAGGEGLIRTILIALALLAVVAFLPRFVRRFRKTTKLDMAQNGPENQKQGSSSA